MIGRLEMAVLDTDDLAGLSTFYREFAGCTPGWSDDSWINLDVPGGWQLGLQSVADYRPPNWPGQDNPQQAHLDFRVPDLEAALARVVALGGRLLNKSESWYTVADPSGHPFDLCANPDDPNTTLMGVMLDCPDAEVLSHFYAELLGKPVTFEAQGMAMIGQDGQQPVLFQQVDDYTAPRWPDPAHPQHVHFDVLSDDFDADEAAVLKLGATKVSQGTDGFRVFTDPAGKPFCLTRPSRY